jgi:trigger factor
MEANVENLSACKKKLSITIPRDEIVAKMGARFAELEREAQVPGFRAGRAPRRLVEKRFKEAVEEEIRLKMIGEAFEQAVKDQKLDIIGEPEVDPDAIKMPDDGPLVFTVEIEVRPEFELPEYIGIPIDVARPVVGDEAVAQSLERLREEQGKIEPVAEGGEIKENDLITCDLAIQVVKEAKAEHEGDLMVVDRQGVRVPVAQIAIEGIRLEMLPELLKGAKVGDTKTATFTIAADVEREEIRNKPAELRVKVGAIERVSLPDDATLLKEIDYESMDALKAGVRRQLESQNDANYVRAQEQAVENWLLEKVKLELPADLAQRNADRVLQRNLVNLQYRGMPVEEIEKRLGDIRSATTEQAARDLKLHFILDKIAKKESIEASDAEVDARLRFIAAQYGRKEDRLREEMAEKGTLDGLRSQILEDKVTRMLLSKAKIAGAEAPAAEAPAAEEPAKPEAEKKPDADAK